jgi:hypothetical protein
MFMGYNSRPPDFTPTWNIQRNQASCQLHHRENKDSSLHKEEKCYLLIMWRANVKLALSEACIGGP